MMAEFLRESGLLVGVFGNLEPFLRSGKSGSAGWHAAVIGVTVVLLVGGVGLDIWRTRGE